MILEKLFFGGLTILPLVFWPRANVPFEVPRVWFFLRWVEVLGIFGIIRFFRFPKRKTLDKRLIFLVSGLLSVATFASFWGADLWKSILGNYYRSDGLITLYHLAGLFLLVALFWEEKWNTLTAWAISIGSFLACISLVILKTDGGSFGHPKFLAGYLLVSLPFTIYLIQTEKSVRLKILFLLAVFLQTLTLALTKSWGGILGIIFITGYIIYFCTRPDKKLLILIGSIFVILTVLAVYLKMNNDKGFVAEGRERIIRRILLGVGKRPVLGWGWANADYAFEAVPWPIPLEHDVYVDRAHSTFLEVLATTGVVGLVFYVGIIVRVVFLLVQAVIKKSHDYWPKMVLLAFLLYLFHAQTNVISVNEELIFWLVAGISCNIKYKKFDKAA